MAISFQLAVCDLSIMICGSGSIDGHRLAARMMSTLDLWTGLNPVDALDKFPLHTRFCPFHAFVSVLSAWK